MVFRDTLVVDTIELANKIGYGQKMRVITLDGILVETSGLISGGGQKRGGLMGHRYGASYQGDQNTQQVATQEDIA